MLHIVKVQDAPLPLFLRKPAAEFLRQPEKRAHKGRAGTHPLLLGPRGGVKIFLLQPGKQVLHRAAKLLRPLPFFRGNGRVLFGTDPAEGKVRKAVEERLKAFPAGQLLHLIKILQKSILIHIRAVRLPAEGERLLQKLSGFGKLPLHVAFQLLHPRAGIQAVLRHIVILFMLFQPFLRPGIAHGEFVQGKELLLQPFVVSLGRKIFRHLLKTSGPRSLRPASVLRLMPFLRFLRFGLFLREAFLQQVGKHIPLQQPDLSLIRHPEIRIQSDLVEMVADQIQAEAVDGGDLGMVDEGELPDQMGVLRLLLHCPGKGKADPLPHLRGGGAGKGHHQKPVDVHGMNGILHHSDDPFYQNGRFAAARGGGDQHALSPRVDGFLLLLCKCHCHPASPPCPFRRFLCFLQRLFHPPQRFLLLQLFQRPVLIPRDPPVEAADPAVGTVGAGPLSASRLTVRI